MYLLRIIQDPTSVLSKCNVFYCSLYVIQSYASTITDSPRRPHNPWIAKKNFYLTPFSVLSLWNNKLHFSRRPFPYPGFLSVPKLHYTQLQAHKHASTYTLHDHTLHIGKKLMQGLIYSQGMGHTFMWTGMPRVAQQLLHFIDGN